ncbi:unnamed protein product, partial [Mesorhabditis belari]|uniref:Uncharacterized protein n=1 Tax=Mesorhabditis belari TaxID=2138241 RepID=A0AAF3J2T2_9BILA
MHQILLYLLLIFGSILAFPFENFVESSSPNHPIFVVRPKLQQKFEDYSLEFDDIPSSSRPRRTMSSREISDIIQLMEAQQQEQEQEQEQKQEQEQDQDTIQTSSLRFSVSPQTARPTFVNAIVLGDQPSSFMRPSARLRQFSAISSRPSLDDFVIISSNKRFHY